MQIAVIGANGRTGQRAVREAARRGHQVVAIARRPGAVTPGDGQVVVREADVLDAASIRAALSGVEAVISAIGVGASRQETSVYSEGTRNVIAAITDMRIRRLVAISAAPAGPRGEQGFVERRIAMPILERFFGATYRDMRRMETVLASSAVDWVALRPPQLVDRRPQGKYRIDAKPLPGARRITFADLATALVDCAENREPTSGPLYVAN